MDPFDALCHDLAIVSDDAGQFNVLIHGLCWVHTERLIHKLLPLNEAHREDIAQVRAQIWAYYADLKDYKNHPDEDKKISLISCFNTIFTQKTRYETLNQLLIQQVIGMVQPVGFNVIGVNHVRKYLML